MTTTATKRHTNNPEGHNQYTKNTSTQSSRSDSGRSNQGSHHKGEVQSPNDGRLKENRDNNVHVDDDTYTSRTSNKSTSSSSRTSKQDDYDRDSSRSSHHQGEVQSPNDGRLKENREKNVHVDDNKSSQTASKSTSTSSTRTNKQDENSSQQSSHHKGEVQSSKDGRLKENREKNVHVND